MTVKEYEKIQERIEFIKNEDLEDLLDPRAKRIKYMIRVINYGRE